ncbi:MAG TPA: hypothetical protein VN226_07435, partial [Anaerolineales bacterium]|nr:hypothetical protein [Anaerolineales bacterium]
TRTPLLVAMTCVLLSILLMWTNTSLAQGGILGIGLALSLSTLIQFLALFLLMHKKYRAIDLGLIAKSQLKVITASAVMGISLWLLMRLLDKMVFDTTRTLPLIGLTTVVGIMGLMVFFGLATLLKIPELSAFTGILKRLGKWRSILSESDEVLESASQTEEVKPW